MTAERPSWRTLVKSPVFRKFAKDRGIDVNAATQRQRDELVMEWYISPERRQDEDWQIKKQNEEAYIEEMRGFRGYTRD